MARSSAAKADGLHDLSNVVASRQTPSEKGGRSKLLSKGSSAMDDGGDDLRSACAGRRRRYVVRPGRALLEPWSEVPETLTLALAELDPDRAIRDASVTPVRQRHSDWLRSVASARPTLSDRRGSETVSLALLFPSTPSIEITRPHHTSVYSGSLTRGDLTRFQQRSRYGAALGCAGTILLMLLLVLLVFLAVADIPGSVLPALALALALPCSGRAFAWS